MEKTFNKLIIFFSNQCNLRCNYCIVQKWNQVISERYFGRLLDFLQKEGNFSTIKFFGGESLLQFKLVEKLVNNFKNKYKWEIVTNGYVVNDEIASFLQVNNFDVYISEDFVYKNKVLDLITKFKKKDKLTVNITLMPGYVNKVVWYIKKLLDIGVYRFNILPVYYKIKWQKNDLIALKRLFEKLVLLKLKYSKIEYVGIGSGKEKLINEKDLFLSYDGNFYLSDLVENYLWFGGQLKDRLKIWSLDEWINYNDLDNKFKILQDFLQQIEDSQLNTVVDYFTSFYNKIFNA